MIIKSNVTGIIADDLTGANDTALQFHTHGATTQILLNNETELLNEKGTMTWAISTESRNIDPETAYHNVKNATKSLTIHTHSVHSAAPLPLMRAQRIPIQALLFL